MRASIADYRRRYVKCYTS